jgi:hypothetical protein
VTELAAYLATHGSDPHGAISQVVTERRIEWYLAHHSTSCGDLLHCVAEACGYRGPALNRASARGWAPGKNLSRWFLEELVPVLVHPRLEDLHPGDFLLEDAHKRNANGVWLSHAAIYLGRGASDAGPIALTADFGQPGGRIYDCQVRGDSPLTLRGRTLDLAVSLDDLEWTEEPLSVPAFCAAHGLTPQPWVPLEYLA